MSPQIHIPRYHTVFRHSRHRMRPGIMPLRARIQPQLTAGRRSVFTQPEQEIPRELPGDEPDDVVFNSIYGLRTIELNRPKKHNSLNGSMIRKIIPRLKEWEKSDMINAVVLKGAGEKALCAGGDVATLAQWNQQSEEGRQQSKDYFTLEYQLDHLIATYAKPYVAFMDGITMGGGVGLSVHAPFRVATERTVFAMPETTIGFFPDVGATFFLPRLDGQLGRYLALTSERLHGVQTYYHGLATHYIHSSSLADVEHRLAELSIPDYASTHDRYRVIDSTLAEYASGLPHDEPQHIIGSLREAIDRCFAPETVEEILQALESDARSRGQANASSQAGLQVNHQPEWAQKTLKAIHGRSPTSLKVTLKQLQYGKEWSIREAFAREHQIASHFMDHPDFVEGVSARLIRKPPTTPQWQPSTLGEISENDAEAFFLRPTGKRMTFLNSGPEADYDEYPHTWIAMPKERDVQAYVRQQQQTGEIQTKANVVQHFLRAHNGKPGVREVVQEIMDRQCLSTQSGLWWRSDWETELESRQNKDSDQSGQPQKPDGT